MGSLIEAVILGYGAWIAFGALQSGEVPLAPGTTVRRHEKPGVFWACVIPVLLILLVLVAMLATSVLGPFAA